MRAAFALAALLGLPAAAGPLVQLGVPGARPQLGLYAAQPLSWTSALGPEFNALGALYGAGGVGPVVQELAKRYPEPAAFSKLNATQKGEAILQAGQAAMMAATLEAQRALTELKALPPDADSATLEVLAARLQMLQGPLARLLPPDAQQSAAQGYSVAYGRLTDAAKKKLAERLDRVARALIPETLFEQTVAELPRIPASLMTPGVERLRKVGALSERRAWDHRSGGKLPPESRSLGLQTKIAALSVQHRLKLAVASLILRPARDAFRWAAGHAGEIWRKYVSGREMDKHNFRWSVLEKLFKEGDFRGSLGHPVYDYSPEIMSPVIFPQAGLEKIRAAKRSVGRDLTVAGERFAVSKLEFSAMMGVSGMSFPQLSAQSHLSLIYIHLKLAKDLDVRMLDNTGEGGPGLHLAVLEGDAERARRYIVDWNKANGQFADDSWGEAKATHFVDALMAKRDELFKEFTQQDIGRAQIVAQFGSALNGIRAEGGFVDFDKLRAIGESPFVAMTQFKLKQAAKRGAKVDPRKVDDVVGALREIARGKPFKSPELAPDFSSYEDIAALLRATKFVTRKPVSLKFGVGDAKDLLDFLTFLKEADALPDVIQLDGRGDDFSPGSGNAPPGANTSLPINDAVIVTDAILKKLGVRDLVYLEATGDVMLPAEAVEKLALGADGVSGARCWMNMGLGCAKVKACANGNCPYGIASKSNSMLGLTLDPVAVAPKGYVAASNWYRAYTQTLAETQIQDWTSARRLLGLGVRSNKVRLKIGAKSWTLDAYYDRTYVENLLRGALTPAEVRRLVFSPAP